MPSTTIAQTSWKLELVVEQLDDDHRAAQCQAHGDVQQREVGALHPEAERQEEREAERHAQRELQHAGDEHRPAGGEQLLEVELETDDEEQQDEADLGDRFDARLVADQTQPDLRSDQHPGEQIGEQQRLAQPVADERKDGRDRDRDTDAPQKIDVLHSFLDNACA
jgi:hypothetical protein